MEMKKEDVLEKFVREHAEAFDTFEVPGEAWAVVEMKIFKTAPYKKRQIVFYAKRIAAAVLIFASAWMLNDYRDSKRQNARVGETISREMPAELKELADAEAFYTSQVKIREDELLAYAQDYPEIIEDLKEEFNAMDLHRNELKNDLAESSADEKVIEAIIRIYRIKLEILDQILTELKKSDSEGSGNDFQETIL